METEVRHTSDALTASGHAAPAPEEAPPGPEARLARLLREGYRYDFFQAVRLMEAAFPEAPRVGETSRYRDERVRLRPSPALVFPAADVKRALLERQPGVYGERRGVLEVTFMGLYGVNAPVPSYYHEEIARENENVDGLRDFLDVFSHRLYAFFYRAWKKYRPEADAAADAAADGHLERFLAFAGLGTPHALDDAPCPPATLAAFAGCFAALTRSAEGLRRILGGLLGGVPVAVVENVPRWVAIPEPTRLGSERARLGATALLGRRMYDVAQQFRIRIGPVGLDAYLGLLDGGAQARTLAWAVRAYVPDYLDFDVELHLRSEEVPPLRLGDRRLRLGLTTFLGRPAEEAVARVVRYRPSPA